MVDADRMNAVRRPILSAASPEGRGTAPRPEAGGFRHLPIGQRPLLGQRRSDVADQKEVEKSSKSARFAVQISFH